jgi:ABC-type multidrug transport system ATPase subunit
MSCVETTKVGGGSLTLEFSEISYKLPESAVAVSSKKAVKARRTDIITGITGQLESGKLTCILGPSGCGKTTLLNILSGRVAESSVPGSKISGKVSISGVVIDPVECNRDFAYVLSDDSSLYGSQTPRESMMFAALLKGTGDHESNKHRVEGLLTDLDLTGCADTLVGSALITGISSGEKKRTAVGIELVNCPKLLFLDEPTTGLDSYAAYTLISLLKKIVSNSERVFLCTVHQPSSEVFFMFDDAMVMCRESSLDLFDFSFSRRPLCVLWTNELHERVLCQSWSPVSGEPQPR